MADKIRITIHKGEPCSLEVGGLRVVACRRELENDDGSEIDGGATLEVWGAVEGEDTEILRFDCFRNAPHYHAPPSAPGDIKLDPAQVGDGLQWALDQLSQEAAALVSKAGFDGLAAQLDLAALRGGRQALSELVAGMPALSESNSFEIDPALLA